MLFTLVLNFASISMANLHLCISAIALPVDLNI